MKQIFGIFGERFKEIFVVLFLILTSSVFSQIKVDAITTGYYECYKDGVKIDQHTLITKATTHCNELKLGNPDSEVWFEYPIQTRVEASGLPKSIKVDTIQVNRRIDVDNRLVGGFLDTVKGSGYFLTYEIEEMICYKTDSIPNWQKKYNFKRTKELGKVSYENLNIPFQIRDIWIDKDNNSTYTVHLTTTEHPKQTSCYLNGALYKQFTPGAFDKKGGLEYFGIWGLYDLDPILDYEVKTVIEGVDGTIITNVIIIKR